jgi:hypothetical protein
MAPCLHFTRSEFACVCRSPVAGQSNYGIAWHEIASDFPVCISYAFD